MFLVLFLLTLAAIFLIRSLYKYFVSEEFSNTIPGPKPLPILGNTLDFHKSSVLQLHKKWFKEFGDTLKCHIIFTPRHVLTCDVNLIQFALTSPKLLGKGGVYKFLFNWLGNGLITVSDTKKWRHHRKVITPSFHFKILEYFLSTFHTFENCLLSTLEKEVDKETIDIHPVVSAHTLKVICSSAMGTADTADEKFFQHINNLCRIFVQRITSPIKSSDLTYFLTSDYKIEKEALSDMYKYTNKVISSRKKELDKKPSLIELTIDEVGAKKKMSFLDTLLNQQKEFNNITDQEIHEEVHTFMLAGYETTASTMSYVLYNLAQYPEIQEKVIEEQRWIFENDKNRESTNKDLLNMKYLEMVIKETLRLYPVVPMIARHVSEDITFGNTTLLKGDDLFVSIFYLHRNPKLYEDPERFDPERFSPENSAKRPTYAYIPFSSGMRNCIGQRYALIKSKSALSKILRTFEILPSPKDQGLNLTGDLILRSTTGIHIRLKKRDF